MNAAQNMASSSIHQPKRRQHHWSHPKRRPRKCRTRYIGNLATSRTWNSCDHTTTSSIAPTGPLSTVAASSATRPWTLHPFGAPRPAISAIDRADVRQQHPSHRGGGFVPFNHVPAEISPAEWPTTLLRCPCSATPCTGACSSSSPATSHTGHSRRTRGTSIGSFLLAFEAALDYRLQGVHMTNYGLLADAPDMYLPQTSACRTERVLWLAVDRNSADLLQALIRSTVWRLITAALDGPSRRDARECYQVLPQ